MTAKVIQLNGAKIFQVLFAKEYTLGLNGIINTLIQVWKICVETVTDTNTSSFYLYMQSHLPAKQGTEDLRSPRNG